MVEPASGNVTTQPVSKVAPCHTDLFAFDQRMSTGPLVSPRRSGNAEENAMTNPYTAPYVNFQGRAREAMEFYHGILGGTLTLFAFDAQGKLKSADPSDPVGYGRLEANGVRLFGSDGNPAYPGTPGDTVAITLAGPNKSALTAAFEALADGGRVQMPLTEAPWGTAGWVTDRFGILWNIDITR
jgi:PhnB protein